MQENPHQSVIVKAKPSNTYVKVTQHNVCNVRFTYVRDADGVWSRIEESIRIDDCTDVEKEFV